MKDMQAIILGAGRPLGGITPSARRKAGPGVNVLEWQLAALRSIAGSVEFVAGYGADAIEAPMSVRLVVNRNWQSSGAARSLFLCELDPERSLLISYADILYRPRVLRALTGAGDAVMIAIDSSHTAQRRKNREIVEFDRQGTARRFALAAGSGAPSALQADLVGLAWVPEALLPALRALRERNPKSLQRGHLGALFEELRSAGVPLRLIDVAGDWTDLDDPGALARFLFGSKAQTLARLATRVRRSRVAPQISFQVRRWQKEPEAIIGEVAQAFPRQALAVRSSAVGEDSFEASQAGKFRSCLNVACNPAALEEAIGSVIASYDDEPDHQVLVQPMVTDVVASGVVFTRTLDHGAPYYVVNYSLDSRTDIVTGGGDETRIAYVHRDLTRVPQEPSFIAPLLAATHEVEDLLDLDTLDLEFAVSADGAIHLLQVRPLAVQHDRSREDDARLIAELDASLTLYEELSRPVPPVVGERSIYGVMPDWNPAEIIGIVPRPLAASLYRALVMDDAWAMQRQEFGYRDLRGVPLMRLFAGHAYVDVRASLNSFVPADVPDSLAVRLVNAALARLSANPEFHDKVEFEIVPTCLDFDFARWNEALFGPAGLGQSEISALRAAYAGINANAVRVERRAWEAVHRYEASLDALASAGPPSLPALRGLLARCRDEAVLPFAHLARCAFVAISLLRTAAIRGILAPERVEALLGSIRTVSHQLADDAAATASGGMTFEDFVCRFGHLRPGTYDITSQSYAEAPERYLRPLVDMPHAEATEHGFDWTPAERAALASALPEIGLDMAPDALLDFMRKAITGREYAKFVFTRTLSAVLESIAAYGARHGLSRDDLSFLDYGDIERVLLGVEAGPEALCRIAATNKARARIHASMILPPLIGGRGDFHAFVAPQVQANFIGSGRAAAPLRVLDETGQTKQSLEGAVVLIQRADPGYEWLFSRRIAGLITAFGGANSHMAIRCAEFGLPAAIGIGAEHYQRLAKVRQVELDCQKRQILAI
jgi:choline kinase/phosphohistidine swiveling domain-containing protein